MFPPDAPYFCLRQWKVRLSSVWELDITTSALPEHKLKLDPRFIGSISTPFWNGFKFTFFYHFFFVKRKSFHNAISHIVTKSST